MIYDTLIIGGGLAGLALALDLKKRGYTVLVIEKGSYPRNKVCGEYISMESHGYLHSLSPALNELKLPRIKKFKLSSTKSKEFTTSLGLGGFGISRYLLEELLYKEGLAKGVVFMLGTKATDIHFLSSENLYSIATKQGQVRALLVCNASGRRSNLEAADRKQNSSYTNYVGVKYHVRLPRDRDVIEIHNFPGGYCGISNIENDKSCLCYIVNASQLNIVNKSIPDLEKRILSKNKNLKHIFENAEFITREPVTISGINFLIKEPLNDGTFFLGDAAGSIAPITGNGMSIALRSASVLAENIDKYFLKKISREELQRNYRVFWNEEFSMRIKLSRYFQKLSEYPFLTRLTIYLFNFFPALAKAVIKLTHGKPF